MQEILQILHQSPTSHHQMHSHFQRGLVNVEPQFNWSFESDPLMFDSFQCSEFVGSSFTNLSSSSVDELSNVTAIIEEYQSLKRRKLEIDVVELESQKQSAECDSGLVEPPKAKRNTCDANSKPNMYPKSDYVYVRARRGQATDSHSLAERVRREKIKKKMQCLQDLVPGCSNITNKAAILDEIITYVQCLQRDVEVKALFLYYFGGQFSTTSKTVADLVTILFSVSNHETCSFNFKCRLEYGKLLCLKSSRQFRFPSGSELSLPESWSGRLEGATSTDSS